MRKRFEWGGGVLVTLALLCLVMSGLAVADDATPTPTVGMTPTPTATTTASESKVYLPILLKPPAPTATPTNTPTNTATFTATATPTNTPTATYTATATNTATNTPTPSPTPLVGWKGEYFANTDLSGSPVVVRGDPEISFIWGASAPAPGVPSDGFSVRWTKEVMFTAGDYVFSARTDDGVRVWVDDNLVIDEWHVQGPTLLEGMIYLNGGAHKVQVEYFDQTGYATAEMWWEASVEYLNWKGEYYDNMGLLGEPVVVRNDPNIEFDWEGDAPVEGLSEDGFSVRWTRSQFFVRGIYRFHTKTDDGVRLWVDGQLVIDKWQQQDNVEWIVDIPLESGVHFIKMEYYDEVGLARAKFWWGRADYFPHWKAEYFSNTTLSGAPVVTRDDFELNFNWGFGAPAAGVPADNFSVRWTRNMLFAAGNYRFYTNTSDGVRLWVDNVLLVDQWRDQETTGNNASIYLSEGQHAIQMEYYDRYGNATAMLWWAQEDDITGWRGEYFANKNLEGSPVFVRNDETINFNWEDGVPGPGLSQDDFSVRWTRDFDFAYSGTYTLRASTDDGVRVWVDDQLIIDKWGTQPETTYQATLWLNRGTHTIRVEYFEGGGLAIARFRWYGGPASEDIIVDAGDSGFMHGGSGAGWQEVTAGYNGHMYWSPNSAPVADNWATWTPELSTPGFYEVFVYVPAPMANARGVRYYAYYDGSRWTIKRIDQSMFYDQWVSLGIWRFKADGSEFLYLTDVTDQPAGSEQVGFDAVRWAYRGP